MNAGAYSNAVSGPMSYNGMPWYTRSKSRNSNTFVRGNAAQRSERDMEEKDDVGKARSREN
jgi:hypothetical protein